MTLQQLKEDFLAQLSKLYDKCESEAIFFLVCDQLLNYSKIEIHFKKDTDVSEETSNQFSIILTRLLQHEPVQYVLGTTEFYGYQIKVDRRVLIPRQETELLVELIIREQQKSNSLKIIDLCTGSGCIAIVLAANLNQPEVTATDISADALELAKENSLGNKTHIKFIEDSVLEPANNYELYDIIVSNPPYVRILEQQKMNRNVLDYEPHLALFVSDSDPLVFYRAIAHFAKKQLAGNGSVYCEINEALGKETADIFIQEGFNNTLILKDLNNKDRFLKATR